MKPGHNGFWRKWVLVTVNSGDNRLCPTSLPKSDETIPITLSAYILSDQQNGQFFFQVEITGCALRVSTDGWPTTSKEHLDSARLAGDIKRGYVKVFSRSYSDELNGI